MLTRGNRQDRKCPLKCTVHSHEVVTASQAYIFKSAWPTTWTFLATSVSYSAVVTAIERTTQNTHSNMCTCTWMKDCDSKFKVQGSRHVFSKPPLVLAEAAARWLHPFKKTRSLTFDWLSSGSPVVNSLTITICVEGEATVSQECHNPLK